MFCRYHAHRIAITTCAKCQAGLCPDCQLIVKGGNYCSSCATFAEAQARPGFRHWPWLAVLLSFIPGMGQVYNGQVNKGIGVFITSPLLLPWLWAFYDAYRIASRIQRGDMAAVSSLGQLSGCLAIVVILCGGPFLGFQIYRHYFHMANINPREAAARKVLGELGQALEAYARDHQGHYPSEPKQLYFTDPPYLTNLTCGLVHGGYRYLCRFTEGGYEVTASPAEDGAATSRTFLLVTGGMIK